MPTPPPRSPRTTDRAHHTHRRRRRLARRRRRDGGADRHRDSSDRGTLAFTLQALELVTVWPLLSCGLVCLLSGVVLGLGGRWGVLRCWWVAVKLAISLVLLTLVAVSLRFEVADQAARAKRLAAGVPVTFDLTNLVYPPTVSPALLLVALTLSVVKPWGRIRSRASAQLGTGRPGRRAVRGTDVPVVRSSWDSWR